MTTVIEHLFAFFFEAVLLGAGVALGAGLILLAVVFLSGKS